MEKQDGELTMRTSTDSIASIIDQVLATRNQKITILLNHNLTEFLEQQYDIYKLSSIKTEFLKKDLLELRKTPLDLAHYSSLIKELKDFSTAFNLDHPLILQELRTVFDKYCL